MCITNLTFTAQVSFSVARRWSWISWAWGCCRPAARWQTSWLKASPVSDGHSGCFINEYAFWGVLWSVPVCFSSCGGHQQETRASAQPGVHLPDYTHWKGALALCSSFAVCLQRRFCSRTGNVKPLRVWSNTVWLTAKLIKHYHTRKAMIDHCSLSPVSPPTIQWEALQVLIIDK